MSHLLSGQEIDFLPARNGFLEPWRWDYRLGNNYGQEYHTLVVSPATDTIIELEDAPESYPDSQNYIGVRIVNRGVGNLNLIGESKTVTSVILNTNEWTSVIYTKANGTVIQPKAQSQYNDLTHSAAFEIDDFNLTPVVYTDHLTESNPYLRGFISIWCDWPGFQTIEIWRDYSTKIIKIPKVRSGHTIFEYKINKTEVQRWYQDADRQMPLDVRTEYDGVTRMLWTGSTLVKSPLIPIPPKNIIQQKEYPGGGPYLSTDLEEANIK